MKRDTAALQVLPHESVLLQMGHKRCIPPPSSITLGWEHRTAMECLTQLN